MKSNRGSGRRRPAGPRLFLLTVALLCALASPGGGQETGARDQETGAGAQETGAGLRPTVAGCPVCDLWTRNQQVILQASREVGSLENGVIYYFHAQNPTVIEPLIRFAYERAELAASLRQDPSSRAQLGVKCEHHLLGEGAVRLEISNSAHGFFAILTSPDEEIVDRLREEASQAIRGRMVRF